MPRTYVITGSASGIGAATRTLLTAQGARVIGVDLGGVDVDADLSTPDGRQAMAEGVRAAAGDHVDAVIACAGIAAEDPRTLRVNYFGAVATLELLRPLLAAGTDPRAVAVSSMASFLGQDDGMVEACLAGDEEAAVAAAQGRGYEIYPASKRALNRWLRRVAPTPDWAGAGIPLNAVGPGVVLTPMTAELLASPEGRELADASVPMPLGGHAQPEAVAELIAWLASPANTSVTGQIVFIDGGADAVTRGDLAW